MLLSRLLRCAAIACGMTLSVASAQVTSDGENRRGWKLVGAASQSCERVKAVSKQLQARLKVATDTTTIAAGELVKLEWSIPDGPFAAGPTYLVVSTPQPVRFVGEGGFALLPQATAPFGIKHARSESRYVVPLHIHPEADSGSIQIRSLRAGNLVLKTAIVAFSNCGEISGAKTAMNSIAVRPGPPLIHVANAFSLTQPELVIQSPTGLHRIEVDGARFRLIENATEVKIADRLGSRPRFSPTGRFVVSLPDTGGEVIDVLDGAIVHGIEDGDIAWDNKDSVIVVGGWGWSGIDVIPSLLEKGTLASFAHRCGVCRATEWFAFKIDWENNVAVAADVSQIEAKILSADAHFRTLSDKPSEIDAFLKRHEAQVVDFQIPKRWEFKDALQFTHVYDDVTAKLDAEQADPLRRFLVRPTILPSSSPPAAPRNDPIGLATQSARSASPLAGQPELSVEARLAEFGFDVRPGSKLRRSDTNVLATRTGAGETENVFALASDPSVVIDATSNGGRCGKIDDTPEGGRRLFTYEPKISEVRGSDFSLTIVTGLCDGGNRGFLNYVTVLHDSRKPGQLLDLGPLFEHEQPNDGGIKCSLSIIACPFEGELFDERYLVMWLGESHSAAVFDIKLAKLVHLIHKMPNPGVVRRVILSTDARSLLKLDADGGFAYLDLSRSQRDDRGEFSAESLAAPVRLEGVVIEGEVVVWNRYGQFDATMEGTSYLSVRYPGREGAHALDQYRSTFLVPGLAAMEMAGQPPRPLPPPSFPPEIVVERKVGPKRVSGRINLIGDASWTSVAVFQDGQLTDLITPKKHGREVSFNVGRLPGARWFTFVAKNGEGLASRPITFDALPGAESTRRLHLLIAGVDRSVDPSLAPLKFARSDAFRIWQAFKARPSAQAAIAAESLLLNAQAGRESILSGLRSIVSKASEGDTIVLFFAGHGVRDADGRLYLATPETVLSDLAGSALAWADVAALLRTSKARVAVFLDTCHSGSVSEERLVTNAATTRQLLADTRNSMVIFSASKGRELSEEHSARNGGVFTGALVDALSSPRSDANGNGALEASELFGNVKRAVVEATQGRQTPWLTRNEMVGDFTLF